MGNANPPPLYCLCHGTLDCYRGRGAGVAGSEIVPRSDLHGVRGAHVRRREAKYGKVGITTVNHRHTR